MITLRQFITNFLEPFSLLLYAVALWIFYRKNKNLELRPLAYFYMVAGMLQLYGSLNVEFKFVSFGNIWVYDTVAMLTAVFVSHHFYRLLHSPAKKRAVATLLVIYVIYVITRNATLDGARLFDSIGYAILSANIALYVFMYFHQLLQKVTNISILKDVNFWLSSGYLVYFIGSFIIFVTYHYFTTLVIKTYTKQERALLTNLWGLHNVLLFIGAASFLIGSLWINSRRKLASS